MRFTFWKDFLALLFPRTCCVCSRSLFDFENQLCKVCLARLPVTTYHQNPQNNDLSIKITGLTRATQVMAYLRFTKKGMSQRLLHQLKYKNRSQIGEELGRRYGLHLMEVGFEVEWDVIMAVPLHAAKLKRRGYNQSLRFAVGISNALSVPIQTELVRVRFTATQTKKSRMERIENVKGVFRLSDKKAVVGKCILLVDDVMTTGATLSECANVLLEAGASRVDLAVIAAGK